MLAKDVIVEENVTKSITFVTIKNGAHHVLHTKTKHINIIKSSYKS